MVEIVEKGRIVTSVSVSKDEYDYVKDKNLMFSQLLHDAIERHKTGTQEIGDYSELKETKDRLKTMSDRLVEALTVLQNNNLKKEYYDMRGGVSGI